MNGLDLLAVLEAQQPFPGAVGGGEGLADLRPAQLVGLGEPLAEGFRQIGHRGEIGDAAVVDPVPQLARPERLGAKAGHFRGELGAAQPDEIAPRLAWMRFNGHGAHIGPRASRPQCGLSAKRSFA